MTQLREDQVLDTQGELCPMPVIKTRLALGKMKPGQVLLVKATDPGSVPDLQAFARATGHKLLLQKEEKGIYLHFLQRA